MHTRNKVAQPSKHTRSNNSQYSLTHWYLGGWQTHRSLWLATTIAMNYSFIDWVLYTCPEWTKHTQINSIQNIQVTNESGSKILKVSINDDSVSTVYQIAYASITGPTICNLASGPIVLEEGDITQNDHWYGGKSLFKDEVDNYKDQTAFTSGILLFNNCDKIKNLFNNIIEDIILNKNSI